MLLSTESPLIEQKPEGAKVDNALEVTVLMPCLNEGETVSECVRQARAWLEASRTAGEVLVVDNGSTDDSTKLAEDAGARVIIEPKRGKGNAVRRGVAEANGRLIVLADSDGTYDLRNLDEMVQPLRDGYDMVTGNRLRGEMAKDAMPWLHRYVGNPLFSGVIGLITRRRFGDSLSGLRAFRREAWERMAPQSTGFELESEICLRAGRHRLRMTEVPVPYAPRQARSKLRAVTHGWQIGKFILLDSADIIFFVPAVFALVLGTISLVIGSIQPSGVEVGSVRWQPVFAGGILVPGATALMTLGLVAKWLAWRRRLSAPGWLLQKVIASSAAFDLLLFFGLAVLAVGLALDGFLLFRWSTNNPPPLPLGLGAIAQTLVVTGLNLIVAAFLLGVLKASSSESDQDLLDEQVER
jgi:glycosyltransferase involved in cell wall biosynthesis